MACVYITGRTRLVRSRSFYPSLMKREINKLRGHPDEEGNFFTPDVYTPVSCVMKLFYFQCIIHKQPRIAKVFFCSLFDGHKKRISFLIFSFPRDRVIDIK